MEDLISRSVLIDGMCSMCDQEACDGMGADSTAVCATISFIKEQSPESVKE